MKGIIYKITNKVNGKSYIGKTRYTLEFRWRQHIHCKDNVYFHKALKKYGIENFTSEILEECDLKEIDSKEIYYIAKYNTFEKGYNLTRGGDENKLYVYTDDNYSEITGMYLAGFSAYKISLLYNVDKQTILKILHSLNIKIRNNNLNINKLEFNELVEDYNKGVSLRELATRYDCSAPGLKEYLLRKGVKLVSKSQIFLDVDLLKLLIDDYINKVPKTELKKKYHCCWGTILLILQNNNIIV